jgi:hypothetical protein
MPLCVTCVLGPVICHVISDMPIARGHLTCLPTQREAQGNVGEAANPRPCRASDSQYSICDKMPFGVTCVLGPVIFHIISGRPIARGHLTCLPTHREVQGDVGEAAHPRHAVRRVANICYFNPPNHHYAPYPNTLSNPNLSTARYSNFFLLPHHNDFLLSLKFREKKTQNHHPPKICIS